jgi:hypothetical protein
MFAQGVRARVGHACSDPRRVQKAEGPSKYEFEGPSLGRVCPVAREGSRSPGGLPGPARHVRLPGATAGPRPSNAPRAPRVVLTRSRWVAPPGLVRRLRRTRHRHPEWSPRRSRRLPAQVAPCEPRRSHLSQSIRLPESPVHRRFPWASTTVLRWRGEMSTGPVNHRARASRKLVSRSFSAGSSRPVDGLGTRLLTICGQRSVCAHAPVRKALAALWRTPGLVGRTSFKPSHMLDILGAPRRPRATRRLPDMATFGTVPDVG